MGFLILLKKGGGGTLVSGRIIQLVSIMRGGVQLSLTRLLDNNPNGFMEVVRFGGAYIA